MMIDFAYSAAEAPNYRYYIGAGEDHTIMGYDKFYEEDSAGIPFVDWVDAMVRNQRGTNGQGAMPWVNAECEECEDYVPCP